MLDHARYNNEYKPTSWAACSLRQNLNTAFLQKAFTAEEQTAIETRTNITKDNPVMGAKGGTPSEDKVFVLSKEEALEYFKDNDARKCVCTAYAGKYTGKGSSPSEWWLRSPGIRTAVVQFVYADGHIYDAGGDVTRSENRVRPAIWVDLTH